MAVVKGPYKATWNSLAVGNTLQGFETSVSVSARPITFDITGDMPIDQLFTSGVMTIDFVLAEYDAGAVSTLTWPWDANRGVLPLAGESLWGLAQELVLTGCGSVSPSTITFYKAIINPDFAVRTPYSHRERFVPIQMIALPVEDGTEGSTAGVQIMGSAADPCGTKPRFYTEVA